MKYEFANSNNLIIEENGQYLLCLNNTFSRINPSDGSLDKSFDGEDGIYIHPDYSYNFLGLRLKGSHIYTIGHKLSTSIYSGIAIRFINSNISSINDVNAQNIVSLYPSLTSENILLNSTGPISKIQIVSLAGYSIYEVNTNQILSQLIDVSNFTPGHYFVIISSNNISRSVRPFVKI